MAITLPGAPVAWSEPTLEHRITVPGLYYPVQRVALADIDGDDMPEVLACDGERVTLYCPAGDATLFSVLLEEDCINYDILLDDLTGDEIADIVIGQYCQIDTYGGDTVCKVELYHSGSAYTTKDSAMFEIISGGLSPLHSPFLTVHLAAVDMSGDGQKELFLSYDRHNVFPCGGHLCLNTSGYTCLLEEFPSPVAWEHSRFCGTPDYLITHEGVPLFAATRYTNFSTIPGNTRSTAGVEIFTAAGEQAGYIEEPFETQCYGDSTDVIRFTLYGVSGNIRSDDYTEILVERICEQTCYASDEVSHHYIESALRLYRFVAPDVIELVWSVTDPPDYSNFFYSPAFPGSFFAIQDDELYQMDGYNGAVLRSCGPLGADTLFWARIPGMSEGSLVAIDNQTVSVYRLDLSTDVEGEQVQSLPKTFELRQPYPNPFNPSCVVEYSLPKSCYVNLAVYNILGQRVATLVDETKPAGDHTAVWNGRDESGKAVGSGTYLFRIQAEEFADSKKMVLLK